MRPIVGVPSHKYIVIDGDAFPEPLYLFVDAFAYAPKAPKNALYFLTHAHSDHYTGLKQNWQVSSPVICSTVTGKLTSLLLDIPEDCFRQLPLHEQISVHKNVKVTLIDANHCPGAVIFLIEVLPLHGKKGGQRIIHTGDFRYDARSMASNIHLQRFRNCDAVYLDTTYCNPKHVFPSQEESVGYVASTIGKELEKVGGSQGSWPCIFLISTYVVGKEKIFVDVFKQCGHRIYFNDDRKGAIMQCLGLDESMFTDDPSETPIHIVKWNFLGDTWPYFRPNFVNCQQYMETMGCNRVVGFVPTGWVGVTKKGSDTYAIRQKGTVEIHLVPYSEHSAFQELIDFVKLIRPVRIIPTVNATDEKAVNRQLKHFANIINVNAGKALFLAKLSGSNRESATIDLTQADDNDLGTCKRPAVENAAKCMPKGIADDEALEDKAVHKLSDIQTLITICGSELTPKEAERLLNVSSGSVERAVGSYFDKQNPSPSGGSVAMNIQSKTTPSKKRKLVKDIGQSSITSFFGKSPSERKANAANPSVEKQAQDIAPLQVECEGQIDLKQVQSLSLSKSVHNTEEDQVIARDAVATSLEKYLPVEHAPWKFGAQTPYLHIARTFESMENTTKRLKISDMLVNAFRSILALSPHDLVAACWLFLGRLAADYEAIEFNVGGSSVSAAMTEAIGVSQQKLRELYKTLGDLGDVAASLKMKQSMLLRPPILTIQGVYNELIKLAKESGHGSSNRKKQIVVKMLRSCRESETKFLVRTLVGALRIGASWRSVIPAVGKAIVIHKCQSDGSQEFPKKEVLDNAGDTAVQMYHVCPNVDTVVNIMLTNKLERWEKECRLKPGIPIKPMLAKISEGVSDALLQLNHEPLLAEWKYDGMRAQIHFNRNGPQLVKIFSRNCEDRTSSFPDIIPSIVDAVDGIMCSCILDAEVVAVAFEDSQDRSVYTIRAFQDLSSRPRSVPQGAEGPQKSHDASQCVVFCFDILEKDGESLLHVNLEQRRQILRTALPNRKKGEVELAHGIEFNTSLSGEEPLGEEKLQSVLIEALESGGEGLMLKRLQATYEPNKRSNHWVKLKRDYCSGLHDDFDLVVLGAWHGNGRKAGWFSPFLMAVWNPETEEYQSVCRCMSGFSDEFYKSATERLSKIQIPKMPNYYRTNETPPIWFEAKEVWQIRGAELSISPVHCAGVGEAHASKGIGLRFPRFIGLRDDKNPEDATTAGTVVDMFRAQSRKSQHH